MSENTYAEDPRVVVTGQTFTDVDLAQPLFSAPFPLLRKTFRGLLRDPIVPPVVCVGPAAKRPRPTPRSFRHRRRVRAPTRSDPDPAELVASPRDTRAVVHAVAAAQGRECQGSWQAWMSGREAAVA
jgi:hypothetical protein